MNGLHNDDGYGDMIAVVSYDELRMKKDVALLQHRQQAYQWTIALSLGIDLDLSWHRHASFRVKAYCSERLVRTLHTAFQHNLQTNQSYVCYATVM
jgi:hypothetical protein